MSSEDEYFYDDDEDGFGQDDVMDGESLGHTRLHADVRVSSSSVGAVANLPDVDSESEPDVFDVLSPGAEGKLERRLSADTSQSPFARSRMKSPTKSNP